MAFKPELGDWQCPICYDLLYKPCINVCGHIFCFWCMHKAMNPYRPSQCPLCRSSYTHFPKVYEQLHHFLLAAFPAEYAERQKETDAIEAETALKSQALPGPADSTSQGGGSAGPQPPAQDAAQAAGVAAAATVGAAAASAAGTGSASSAEQPDQGAQQQGQGQGQGQALLPQEPDFLCAHPACGKLLCDPVVLSCGHAVCSATCSPAAAAAAAASSQPAAAGASAAAASSSRQQHQCPACHMQVLPTARPCAQVQQLLSLLFPERAALRAAEVQQWLAQHLPQQQHQQGASSQPCSGAQPPVDTKHPKLKQIEEMVKQRCRAARGAGGQELWAEVASALEEVADDTFSWYMVGCDHCGVYPIVGRRFRCRDCPDAVGFDLCGACQDSGTAGIGRFNQAHTAGHVMEQVKPKLTAPVAGGGDMDTLVGRLNVLASLHPELSVEQAWLLDLDQLAGAQAAQQAMDLLRLAVSGGAAAQQQQGQGQGQGQQQGQGQGQAQPQRAPEFGGQPVQQAAQQAAAAAVAGGDGDAGAEAGDGAGGAGGDDAPSAGAAAADGSQSAGNGGRPHHGRRRAGGCSVQ